MMLIKKNATVTVCHTKTVDMPSVAREADIIIVAAGRAGVIGAEYVNRADRYRCLNQRKCRGASFCGDVDYAADRADRRCNHSGTGRCWKCYHIRSGKPCGSADEKAGL